MSNRRNSKQHVRPLADDSAHQRAFAPPLSQAHARPQIPDARGDHTAVPNRITSATDDGPRPPMSRVRDRRHRRQSGFRIKSIYWVIGIALIGIVCVVVGPLAAGGSHQAPTAIPSAVQSVTAGPTPTMSLNIKPWDGKGRFTVLVLGIDNDGTDLSTSHTDMMMILSVDPVTHSGAMLSIPRDLFMPIPGESDMQRVNTAFEIGELKQPGGGPKLAMQTVQYNFGIPVNNYVLFTFDAVVSVIDAVGGIDINVPKAIDDEQYPGPNNGFDPLRIPAGLIHMDGMLALKYARTRHNDSDFERTHREQDVILAVRDKVVRLNMLPQLVQQAPTLWSQLQGNLLTDLSLDQILSLAMYARDIAPNNIHHASIEGEYVRPIQWQGDTVLTPDRTQMAALMTQVFGPDYTH